MSGPLAFSLPALALIVVTFVLVAGVLILYALRNKGDVFAELSHGKTTLRIDAKDRRTETKL